MDVKGIILNGGNWPAWRLQTSIVLKARDLFEVVSSPKPQTEDKSTLEKWEDKDKKAQELIILRIDESVLPYLSTCVTSHEMWERLVNLYEAQSKVGVHLMQQKFYNLKFEAPMAKFLASVEEIVAALKSKKEEISEKMVITKILMTLPDCYRHFISAWESVPPDQQTLSSLSSRLLVEEERNGACDEEATTALLTKSGQPRKFSERSASELKCYECGMTGHFRKDCRNRKCNYCGKIGHIYRDCRARQSSSKSPNAFIMPGYSLESWVMDTGASEHMCKDLESFTNYSKVSDQFVTIGDGKKLKILGIGDVKIDAFNGKYFESSTLTLKVLNVSDLEVNLLSVQ